MDRGEVIHEKQTWPGLLFVSCDEEIDVIWTLSEELR